jgi:hypothetical protein
MQPVSGVARLSGMEKKSIGVGRFFAGIVQAKVTFDPGFWIHPVCHIAIRRLQYDSAGIG